MSWPALKTGTTLFMLMLVCFPSMFFNGRSFFLFFSMGAKIHVQQFLDYSKCRGSLLPSIDFFLPVTALLRDPAKGGDLGVGQRTEFF